MKKIKPSKCGPRSLDRKTFRRQIFDRLVDRHVGHSRPITESAKYLVGQILSQPNTESPKHWVGQTLNRPNTESTKDWVGQIFADQVTGSSGASTKHCVDQTLRRPNIASTKDCFDKMPVGQMFFDDKTWKLVDEIRNNVTSKLTSNLKKKNGREEQEQPPRAPRRSV